MNQLLKKYNQEAPRYTSYPPVPFWKGPPEHSIWLQHLEQKLQENEQIDLYIHIPFCQQLCYYCGCNREITKSKTKADEYILSLEKEWSKYTDLLGQKIKLNSIHLGGGTPTFLSAPQLDRLLKNFIPYTSADFIGAIEVDPRTCKKEHLETLKRNGFKRLSLGIQDFDPHVQSKINRHQPYELVKKIVDQARELQFNSINFDLIYGLPGQNLTTIEQTFKKVKDLNPDTIAFYNYAHLPSKIKNQRLISDDDLPSPLEKRALYEQGKIFLRENGYTEIGMDHYARENSYLDQSLKEGKLMRSFMGYTDRKASITIGLGASAIGQTQRYFVQNPKSSTDYQNMLQTNQYKFFAGHQLSEEEEAMAQIVQDCMCHGSFHLPDALLEKLSSDQKNLLTHMENDGLFTRKDENKIHLSKLGMSLVRNILLAIDPLMQNQDKGQFSKTI